MLVGGLVLATGGSPAPARTVRVALAPTADVTSPKCGYEIAESCFARAAANLGPVAASGELLSLDALPNCLPSSVPSRELWMAMRDGTWAAGLRSMCVPDSEPLTPTLHERVIFQEGGGGFRAMATVSVGDRVQSAETDWTSPTLPAEMGDLGRITALMCAYRTLVEASGAEARVVDRATDLVDRAVAIHLRQGHDLTPKLPEDARMTHAAAALVGIRVVEQANQARQLWACR